jgi:hypothetical protein
MKRDRRRAIIKAPEGKAACPLHRTSGKECNENSRRTEGPGRQRLVRACLDPVFSGPFFLGHLIIICLRAQKQAKIEAAEQLNKTNNSPIW